MRVATIALLLSTALAQMSTLGAEVFDTKQANTAEAKRLAATAQAETAFINDMERLVKSPTLRKNGDELKKIENAIYAAQVRLARASTGPGVWIVDASDTGVYPVMAVKAGQTVTYKVTGTYTYDGGEASPQGAKIGNRWVGNIRHFTYRGSVDGTWDTERVENGFTIFKVVADGNLAFVVYDSQHELTNKRGILRVEVTVK